MSEILRLKHLESYLRALERTLYKRLTDIRFAECGYIACGHFPKDSELRPFEGVWGGKKNAHFFFRFDADIPETDRHTEVLLDIRSGAEGWDATNPQMLLYENREIKQAMDTNHNDGIVTRRGAVVFDVYAYTGTDVEKPLSFTAGLYFLDKRVQALAVRFKALIGILEYQNGESRPYAALTRALVKAAQILDLKEPRSAEFYQSVSAATAFIDGEKNLYAAGLPTVHCVGHTHIDVAWLWEKRQTEEKAVRSFATAAELLERYKGYTFMSSQPRLYRYVKENAPALYERIRGYVRSGRWETEGGMWVEADCNLTSGEFLVRQLLCGKRFFLEEFGTENRVLWLPDVFGYAAALPQILKKCGIDLFVTSKISWNDTNRMPHDVFLWRGIDGTETLTYFITTQKASRDTPSASLTTYNGDGSPAEIAGTYKRFSDKALSGDVLMPYGYGDGGGGTTRDMIETVEYLAKGVDGCCKTVFSTVDGFRKTLIKNLKNKPVPRWCGELYLEFHRGTYTSVGRTKKNNRKSEYALLNAEKLSVLSETLLKIAYPKRDLDIALEKILTNQFHDILPGSSIGEVYAEADREYAEVFSILGGAIAAAHGAIQNKAEARADGLLVFNPNPFLTDGAVRADGKTVFVRGIPANGYRVVEDAKTRSGVTARGLSIVNGFWSLRFNAGGEIVSLYDKKARREVIKKGGTGNRMTAYEDLPYEYDNWELKAYYREKGTRITAAAPPEYISDGARGGLRFVREFLSSVIVQTVWLYGDTREIEFETRIDWNERHLVLKSEFDTAIMSDKAVFDIQFGCVERNTHENTSWDAAKFETCAHKFVDISEFGYGVALLNDAKYGHSVKDGTLGLTLLKSGMHPYADADKGEHVFTYALLPHEGDYRTAGVVERAYLFNNPLTACPITRQSGVLPDTFSLVSVAADGIFPETLKKSEDGSGYVLRVYEGYGQRRTATVNLGFPIGALFESDMTERAISKKAWSKNSFHCEFSPYEIKTFLLYPVKADV
ncbi:MAG: glycosyl hydrolase-related protein [Clostridiales bacterium]|jgi:alpha-mannosidase|nr:glycosyl hydrolase-related protein [Clostridiales bacterium]